MARRRPEHFKFFKGPFALVAQCSHCKHFAKRQKLRRPALGKRWGFTAVNELRVEMNQHIRAAHPELFKGKE